MNNPSPLEAVFFGALNLRSPQERTAYLDEACTGNPELRQRVEKMLEAQVEAKSFLELPADGHATTAIRQVLEGPGTTIDVYTLLEEIGEGGFGVVFMAEQTKPVRRKVALKILKPGMDTRQVVARFEAERQALAIMDHPNIARVFDGGTTATGRPYFVMEWVKGVPITEYCDQNQLAPRRRLELFVSVCQAVQHAHQKGIIHRDLKPSNVLVSRHDTTPVVKVIDFGVAKAVGPALTDKTLFTRVEQMIGTPLYMSPEQAGMSDLDVDTRGDIYSLGVLLYELLTGSTPFTKERFKTAAYDEIRRIIREEEPPKPSTRLSSSTDSLPSISAQRQMEPGKLTRLLRGELDWIVMKALEKDRNRRYETANGFAMDVQRYLADEPVSAGPPSAWYRVRKFARRNKGPVLAAAAILFVLLAGVAGTTYGLIQAEHRRKEAEQAEAVTLADYRASTDDAIEQLIGSKPTLGPQEKAYLEKTLKRWQAFAARQGNDQRSQAIRAEGSARVAHMWHKLGKRDEAREGYETACHLFKNLTAAFPNVPQYQNNQAQTHINFGALLAGMGQNDDARSEYEKARDLQKELAAAFPNAPKYRQTLARIHNNLGSLLRKLNQHSAARTEFETGRDIRQTLCAAYPGNPQYEHELGNIRSNLATLLRLMNQRDAARIEAEAALDLQLKLAAKFPDRPEYQEDLAQTHNNLAILLRDLGHRDAAQKEYEAACESQRKLAESFPAVPKYQVSLGGYYCNVGNLRRDDGRSADSLQWFDLAIRTLTPAYEQDRRDDSAGIFLRNSHAGRAKAFDNLKNHAAALHDWDRAVELSTGPEQPLNRRRRAMSRLRTGKTGEAISEIDELMKVSTWSAQEWFSFACAYSVASKEIAEKKQEYADRSMEVLRQAVNAGYRDPARIARESYLAPLRQRADFQKLLKELESGKK